MSETKKRGKVRVNIYFAPELHERIHKLADESQPQMSFTQYVNAVLYEHVRQDEFERRVILRQVGSSNGATGD